MRYLFLIAFPLAALLAAEETVALRGKLIQQDGAPPAILAANGKKVTLTGDQPTLNVLTDPRLKDSDFEALGHYAADGHFEVNHIHLVSLFVYRGGRRLQVSYWCDVCYIRTSSPGKCWCCQKPTDFDPIEPQP